MTLDDLLNKTIDVKVDHIDEDQCTTEGTANGNHILVEIFIKEMKLDDQDFK